MDVHALAAGTLEAALEELVKDRGALRPGEMLVHFDLVACTRWIDDGTGEEKIDRKRWTTPGADPHLSYAYLNAEAGKIFNDRLI